jgi:hypothetical protein
MINQVKTCRIVISLFTASVVAQPLYKSVNSQGEVTFSDKPLTNAVEVQEIQVQPGPTESQQREGAERLKRIESQASDLGAANNDNYNYPNRPLYPPVARPPVRPEHPINPGVPGRPVRLPAAPIRAPGR